MLTPGATRGRTGSTGPMDRTCVSTGRSPEPAVPRRLNAPTPNVGDRRGGNPRHERVVLRARLLRPAGRSRDGSSAHFLNPASDAVYVGPSRERTANGRRSSAGQHRVHSCDRRKGLGGPRRLGPGVQGSPQREPALPTETAREQSTRGARSSHPFGAGAGSQPSCGRRGQAVVRRTVPLRSLDDWLVPACYQ